MKYLVLLIGDGDAKKWSEHSEEEQGAVMEQFGDFDRACRDRDGVELLAGEALSDPRDATVMRTTRRPRAADRRPLRRGDRGHGRVLPDRGARPRRRRRAAAACCRRTTSRSTRPWTWRPERTGRGGRARAGRAAGVGPSRGPAPRAVPPARPRRGRARGRRRGREPHLGGGRRAAQPRRVADDGRPAAGARPAAHRGGGPAQGAAPDDRRRPPREGCDAPWPTPERWSRTTSCAWC